MIFPDGSVIMPDKKTLWWTKATLPKFLTDRCGCKIQYLKFGSVPILLIQEKPVTKFATILYKS